MLQYFQQCTVGRSSAARDERIYCNCQSFIMLRNNFVTYFKEEMKKLETSNLICNPFQDELPTNLSAKASTTRIDLSEKYFQSQSNNEIPPSPLY